MNNTSPLVSFCVKSFNQKSLLVEALKGAFAQTYRPLEIVISDDGSSDGSWEYIQAACKAFKERINKGEINGKVAVVINRNKKNLGNLGNWQKCGELSTGELCIKADGDDISLPNRTTKIVEAWLAAGRDKIKVISHGGWKIDGNGKVIGRVGKSTARNPIGAVMAWTRDCFDGFGEILYPRAFDDIVFGRRGLILGGDLSIDDALVFYRIGSGVTSYKYNHRAAEVRLRNSLFDAYAQVRSEIKCTARIVDEQTRMKLLELLDKDFNNVRTWHALQGADSVYSRFVAYHKIAKKKPNIFVRCYLFLHVLPIPIGALFLFPYYFVKYWGSMFRFMHTPHPNNVWEHEE